MNAIQIIAACQAILTRFLPPDGIKEEQCIHELLEVLDGPDAVQLTMGQIDERARFEQALQKRREISKALFSEPPLKNVSGAPDMASSDVRASIATSDELTRLRDELARVRAHELHLIQDRDRLIHGDLAALHVEVKSLTAQRDEHYARRVAEAESNGCRMEELSAKISSLQARLHRAEEKLKSVAFALVEAS